MAVFTLENKQIIWTDKSSQTNKLSDVQTNKVFENQIVWYLAIWKEIFQDDLPIKTNKSSTVQN